MAATSSTVAKRFSEDEGRACSKNSFSTSSFDLFCCFAIAPTRPCTPSDYPSLLRECEKLFQKEPKGRTFLLRILAQSGDDETKTFLESCVANVEYARANVEEALQDWSPGAISPLTKPVGTAADLDLLWCEFHATESTAPVRRIIDVLERPDHVRGKLEDWLHATARARPRRGYSTLAAIFRRLMIRRLWKKASILCDADRNEVLSPQDLD
jgi:hypothetical protein